MGASGSTGFWDAAVISMVPRVTHSRPANQVWVRVALKTAALMTPVSRILAAVVMAVTDTAVILAKALVNRVIMPALVVVAVQSVLGT